MLLWESTIKRSRRGLPATREDAPIGVFLGPDENEVRKVDKRARRTRKARVSVPFSPDAMRPVPPASPERRVWFYV